MHADSTVSILQRHLSPCSLHRRRPNPQSRRQQHPHSDWLFSGHHLHPCGHHRHHLVEAGVAEDAGEGELIAAVQRISIEIPLSLFVFSGGGQICSFTPPRPLF